jgi:hypothetical protein
MSCLSIFASPCSVRHHTRIHLPHSGDVIIEDMPDLTLLNLTSLQFITGSLVLRNLSSLTTLEGLEGLEIVGTFPSPVAVTWLSRK